MSIVKKSGPGTRRTVVVDKIDPEADREPRMVPADSPIGTTHDPNSVTTGTDAEPDDRFPPKSDR